MDTSHLFLRDRDLTAHANIYNISHLFVSENSSLKKGGLKVYDKHLQKVLCNVLPKCLYFHPVSHKE